MGTKAAGLSTSNPPDADVRNTAPKLTIPDLAPPKTTADVLIEIRQEIARQNELYTQTLQLLLQIVRERQLIELSGLSSAEIVLAEDMLGGKPGDFVSPTARDGLHTVIAVIVHRVRDLDSWWTQLHELGVMRGGEKADG